MAREQVSEDTLTSAAKTTHENCSRNARVGGLLASDTALAVEGLDLLDAPPLVLGGSSVWTDGVASHDSPPPLCLALLDGPFLVSDVGRERWVRGVDGVNCGQFGQDEMCPFERFGFIIATAIRLLCLRW